MGLSNRLEACSVGLDPDYSSEISLTLTLFTIRSKLCLGHVLILKFYLSLATGNSLKPNVFEDKFGPKNSNYFIHLILP